MEIKDFKAILINQIINKGFRLSKLILSRNSILMKGILILRYRQEISKLMSKRIHFLEIRSNKTFKILKFNKAPILISKAELA